MCRKIVIGANVTEPIIRLKCRDAFTRPISSSEFAASPFNMFDKTQGTWTQILFNMIKKIAVVEDIFKKNRNLPNRRAKSDLKIARVNGT